MVAELAFATSLTRKVYDACRFLMDVWKPVANAYLFGFSRGAYTGQSSILRPFVDAVLQCN
jgi:uncharacterized protein (DUF2235 family)